jgi:hypothetical protein
MELVLYRIWSNDFKLRLNIELTADEFEGNRVFEHFL